MPEVTDTNIFKKLPIRTPEYNLRVLETLRFAFGYRRLYLPFIGVGKPVQKGYKSKYDDLKVVEINQENKSSFLGLPLMMPLRIQISPKNEPIEWFDFPNEPIIEIRGSKKIVETDLDGQDGTYKQLYSMGDYEMTIRGVAVDDDYTKELYPEDIVRKLRRVFELRNHLEVQGPLFTIFNIKYITMYDFNLVPNPGEPSMAPYQFISKSDKEFKLTLKRKSQA